jgi:hypothetical protein
MLGTGSERAREPGGSVNGIQSRQHAEFLELTDDLPEVKALETMPVAELVAKYQEVFGEPTRSRNRVHLVRSISWRIQELAFGGLSAETVARIAVLSGEAPRPWRRRLIRDVAQPLPPLPRPARTPLQPPRPRDPRLPPVGTILRRSYRGETHEVTVLDDGFEFRGKQYATLSRIAREATGTPWNGFTFFRIAGPRASEVET